jgi:hypothetical protein
MYDTSANFLNVHEWAYGLTEVAHILSLAVGIGLIALVDLRLLGMGLSGSSPARLARATTLVSLVGLIIAVTSGLMILSTDPIRYIAHPTMRLKLVLVPIALAFNYTIRARIVRGGYLPAVGRSVAVVSLMLWVSIVFSGIFYAFT